MESAYLGQRAFEDMTVDELRRFVDAWCSATSKYNTISAPLGFPISSVVISNGQAAQAELRRRAASHPQPLRPPPSFAQKREIVKARQAIEREREELTAAGYRKHETDWEIHRGARCCEVIVDAKISQCGKYVWTKLGPKSEDA